MIWPNNQYFSLVCVQLLEVGGHPVLNGSKAAVQIDPVIVFFRDKWNIYQRIISIAVEECRSKMANNMAMGQQIQTGQNWTNPGKTPVHTNVCLLFSFFYFLPTYWTYYLSVALSPALHRFVSLWGLPAGAQSSASEYGSPPPHLFCAIYPGAAGLFCLPP